MEPTAPAPVDWYPEYDALGDPLTTTAGRTAILAAAAASVPLAPPLAA